MSGASAEDRAAQEVKVAAERLRQALAGAGKLGLRVDLKYEVHVVVGMLRDVEPADLQVHEISVRVYKEL